MIGEVEVENLREIMVVSRRTTRLLRIFSCLLQLWLDNQSTMSAISSLYGRVAAAVSGLRNAFFGQTRSRARLNVIASYDQSNELFKVRIALVRLGHIFTDPCLFQAFLSKEMMYSCALWSDEEGGVRGDMIKGPTDGDLEAAQQRKIHHVLKTLRVKPGDRILEFGTGWGGLAIEVRYTVLRPQLRHRSHEELPQAAASYGCEVDTLTLSIEQKALAEERIKERGLVGRVRVHLMDYRDIPAEWENAFDAFVSIEMLEHVGSKVSADVASPHVRAAP